MTSVVQICNLALGNIGSKASITSLTEASTEASYCNKFYEHSRDTVLADFPWSFARKRQVLALTTQAVTDWEYVYAYPSDCLKALHIVQSDRQAKPIAFEIGLGSSGASNVILTDQESAELAYTAKVSTPSLFSSLFVDALSWKLASKLAPVLTNDPNFYQIATQQYAYALSAAWTHSAGEGQADEPQDSEFIRARS